jgi:alkanesulfonate monooxygenase SsuD/methylene tetrahydromethanopterin reductase-like flavin-dependent oxidoreductase (luciferase family)
MARVGLSFDLRNPSSASWADHYGRTFELIVESERLGIDVIKVTEHHMFADGYMPQPLLFLGAVAARTTTIRLSTGVLIAPLHSAVEIAEQAALLDAISGGRIELGLGTGYRRTEYELYDVPFEGRLRLFRERVEEIRRLWQDGGITPRPLQDPIPLWAGFSGPKGSRLAGRLGMGRLHLDSAHWSSYLEGLAEGGHPDTTARLGGSIDTFLADDPERAASTISPRIEYNERSYADHARDDAAADIGPPPSSAGTPVLNRPGQPVKRHLLTPAAAAERVALLADGRQVDTVFLAGTVAGVVDEHAFRNAELAATVFRPLLQGTG